MYDKLDESKLTEKQRRFIDYYVETANATESAIKAGYSEKTASQDEVLEYLTRVMRGQEKDQFDLEASLQDRTKCAELLGKRYGTFIDKKDINLTEINVSLED